ncbi:hypothetical protein Bcen2424_0919 [Burkholderia cenocepacia HI2424]|nr:hypothetical protein Bcen2424_0919 [Burkholderia cenocepacia HI2424]
MDWACPVSQRAGYPGRPILAHQLGQILIGRGDLAAETCSVEFIGQVLQGTVCCILIVICIMRENVDSSQHVGRDLMQVNLDRAFPQNLSAAVN